MSKNLKNALEITLVIHIIGWSGIGVVFLMTSFALWDIVIPDLEYIRSVEALVITFSIIGSIATAEFDI